VYGPLILGAIMVVFLMGLFMMMMWGSRKSAQNRVARIVPVLAAWMMGATFSMVGVLPLHKITPKALVSFAVGCVGVILAVTALSARRGWGPGAVPGELTPASCWHGGLIYYNPMDPALFVDKRSGLRMTLNFGNRLSWVVLGASVLLPPVVVFLAVKLMGSHP
jgi:uncharacterized membrane protein